MSKNKSKSAIVNWLISAMGLLLILLFCAQWHFISKNFSDFKKEQIIELERINKLRSNALININKIKENDSTIVVEIESIENINERFDDLFEYVQNNTNRAESLIDKDLDRLNLYITLGIGFIAILGVFIPMLVNVISVQDLRDKLNNIPKIETIEEVERKANEAIEKTANINDLTSKLDNLKEDYEQAVPAISTLILQNAIGRFFNISPFLLTRLTRKTDRKYFINLLEVIKVAFAHCENDKNHSVVGNDFMISTINDFKVYITDIKFQTTYFDKIVFIKFQELGDLLGKLVKTTRDNETSANLNVRKKIEEIIDELKNK